MGGPRYGWVHVVLVLVVFEDMAGGANVTNATNETIGGGGATASSATNINVTVMLSVTVGGFGIDQSLRLPKMWVAAVAWESTEASTGECPVGRYCPGGVGGPNMCMAGSYSSKIMRVDPCGEGDVCNKNYYCPDPGVMLGCPAHSHSALKSVSPLDCACDLGFLCVYTKQINLNMVLQVPMGVWVSESGRLMRDKVLQAVAEAAGVSIGNVQVDQVLPHLSTGGAGRRLLESTPTILLRLTLHGAEQVEEDALHARLAEIFPVPQIKRWERFSHAKTTRVHWARSERVHVKRRKFWMSKQTPLDE